MVTVWLFFKDTVTTTMAIAVVTVSLNNSRLFPGIPLLPAWCTQTMGFKPVGRV